MIGHIVHDKDGTISAVVLQAADLEGGELEMHTSDAQDVVTVVDLDKVSPEVALATGHMHLAARNIRTNFRVDPNRKTLVRTK